MIAYNKTIILNEHNIILPMKAVVKDMAWCPDSSDLAIVDNNAGIYISNATGSEIKFIILSKRCNINSQIECPRICWYNGGIALYTLHQLHYYQKNNFSSEIWSVKCKNSILSLISHPLRNDRFFYITINGQIVQINCTEDNSEPKLHVIHFLRGKYLFVDFIQPWEEYIIAIDDSMDLSVIQANKGTEIASLKLETIGKITSMASHPKYPLAVACSNKGEVIFVSLLHYHNPKTLGKYTLQSEILDIMRISSSGRFV
jgi:hypothetical protein